VIKHTLKEASVGAQRSASQRSAALRSAAQRSAAQRSAAQRRCQPSPALREGRVYAHRTRCTGTVCCLT